MDARSYPIETVFGGEKQFTVPRFQRGYRWKQEEHWTPLWEELRDMAERLLEGTAVDSYYLGAIVVQPMPARGFRPSEYQVVDGQQRLTTLQLLLAALRDVCQELSFPHQIKVSGLIQNHEVDRTLNPNDLFKVWPTDSDREIFRLLLNSDPALEIEKSWPLPRRARGTVERPGLVRAYIYFRDEINEFAHGKPDDAVSQQDSWIRLERLLEILRQKIQLVAIELGTHDDPMMIFEALNGRAEPLLPSDLIKNAVLRSAGTDAERLHDLYWKRFGGEQAAAGASFWQGEHKRGRLKRSRLDLFLTDYLQFHTQSEVKSQDLFKQFSNWWRGEMKHNSPEKLMKTLVGYAELYQQLLTADRADQTPASVFCANVRLIDFTLAYPLLLSVLKELPDKGGVVSDDLPGILEDIESYLVRRAVCGLTGKKYNYVFPEILKSIRQTRQLGEMVTRQSLRQRMLAFSGETVEWPDDRNFARAWAEDPLYERLPTPYLKVIFARLAEGRRKRRAEPVTVAYEQMTVEHLMPQDWREYWPAPPQGGSYRGESETAEQRRERLIHTIGNLTLLGQPLNSAVRNNAWNLKREQIRQHGMFLLNGDFLNLEEWSERAIVDRSDALLSEAKKLWPHPEQGATAGEQSRNLVPPDVPPPAPIKIVTTVQTTTEASKSTDNSTPAAQNPFGTGTNYWAIVEALTSLGVDQSHNLAAILPAVQKAMGSEAWANFANKPPRNEQTGKTADERVIQNISVVARGDYGRPLRERGYEVRYDGRQKTAGLFKLQT